MVARCWPGKQLRWRRIDMDMSTWTAKLGHVGNKDQRRIKRILLQHQRETSNQSKIRTTPTPFVFRRIPMLNPRDAAASPTHDQNIVRPSSDTSPRAARSPQGLPSTTPRLHPPGFPKCVLHSCVVVTPAHREPWLGGNQRDAGQVKQRLTRIQPAV